MDVYEKTYLDGLMSVRGSFSIQYAKHETL